jgi:hypothetical protein
MQRVKRSLFALGTIAAVCAVAWQWSSNSAHTPRRAAFTTPTPPRATPPPIMAAVASPASTRGPIEQREPANIPAIEEPVKGASEDPPKPVGPQPLSHQDAMMRVAERNELSGRWTAEAKSSGWTEEANEKIRGLLAPAGLNVNAVTETDCRQTICRFNLSGTDGASALALIRVARQLHDETWVDHKQQSDGTWRIEVFFSKSGYRLSGGGGPIRDEQ